MLQPSRSRMDESEESENTIPRFYRLNPGINLMFGHAFRGVRELGLKNII